MPELYRVLLYLALFFGTLVYAGLRGGAPERLAALVIFLDVLLSGLLARSWQARFGGIEGGVLLADGAALIALVAITVKAERHWPRWIAGLKLVQVLSHLPIIIRPEVDRYAYHALQAGLSYPELAILVAATIRHRRRLKRFGKDRSWSASSPR